MATPILFESEEQPPLNLQLRSGHRLFAGLPALIAGNVWGLPGLKPMKVFQDEPWRRLDKALVRPYRFVWLGIRMAVTYYLCFVGALALSGLSNTPVRSSDTRLDALVLAVVWAAFGISIAVVIRYFESAPGLCAALLAITSTLGTQFQVKYTTAPFEARFIWLYAVALVLAQFARDFGPETRAFSLSNWFAALLVVSLVAIFAAWIYPDIRPAFGGGAPTRVVLQFEGPSPIDNSKREQAWLLEESDSGYYVLQAEHDRKAIFVPRRLVTAVYFGISQMPSDAVGQESEKGRAKP